MAIEDAPSFHLDPSDVMKSLFRRTVMSTYGRRPADGKLTVTIDRYGYSVNEEIIEAGRMPAQRIAIDRWITLTTEGELTKHEEAEPLNKRLAREIKNPGPQPSQFDVDVKSFRSAGFTEQEAFDMAIGVMFASPGIARACTLLVKHLDTMDQEAALGLNAVNAFELADVIQRTRDNFGLGPAN